jgi:integrase
MARVKLTAGRIDSFACEPGREQCFLWHTTVPQLALRATANGAKAFVFQSALRGRTIRTTIGSPKTWSIGKAENEARRLQTLIDEGRDPRQVKQDAIGAAKAVAVERAQAERATIEAEARESITLGTVWAEYILDRTPKWGERHRSDHIKMIKDGGQVRTRSKKKVTEAAPLASLAGVRLVDLTMERIDAWAKVEAATRPTSARLALRLLKAFLNWCQDHPAYRGIHASNPARSRKARETLGKPVAKHDSLQREQLAGWFAAVRLLANPVMAAYLQTLLLTGARPGEILEMRWDDVNTRWKGLTIRDKVEGEREIPLTPYVASLLSTLPRRSAWVFSNPKRGHITSPNYQLNSVCRVAGIEDLTLHGLRRSFKSLCEWLALPAGVVAQIQGHKPSATIEKHYANRPLDLLRLHHEAIETWILAQAGVAFVPSPVGLKVVSAT